MNAFRRLQAVATAAAARAASALVLAAATAPALAQIADPNAPAVPPLDPAIAESAPAQPARPSARSLFALTIAGLVAQGIGNGIGNGLSQGIGGSILKWFTGGGDKSQASTANAAGAALPPIDPLAPEAAASAPPAAAQPQAGLAYEVHRLASNGQTRPVDPARDAFRNGDKFVVYYRPALPGRVRVYNVNPHGEESQIDAQELAGGGLATLGPYKFVGAKGEESLRIVAEACSTPELTVATRNIVKTSAPVAANARPALVLADCAGGRDRGATTRPRTIRKTTFEGSTAFALDPISSAEQASGVVAPRSLTIRFVHR